MIAALQRAKPEALTAVAGAVIGWLVTLGPFEVHTLSLPIGPLKLTFVELIAAAAALAIAVVTAIALRQGGPLAARLTRRLRSPAALALGLWACVHVGSAAWAGEFALSSLKFGLRVSGGVVLGLLTMAWGEERAFQRRVRTGVLTSLLAIGVVALLERVFGQAFEPLLDLFRDEPTWMLGEPRLSTVFYHANTMAAWLELTIPWLLVVAATAHGRKRWLWWPGLAWSLWMLSLTYSRAGLAAGLIAAIAVAWAARRGGAPRLMRLAALSALVLAGSFLANPDMRARLGLEERGYKASYAFDTPCVGHPGERIRLAVRVTNEGQWPLSDAHAPGELAHVVWPERGRPAPSAFRYTPLPPVDAGESVTVAFDVDLPKAPGAIDVVVDIRRKEVIWLSAAGVMPAKIACVSVSADEAFDLDSDDLDSERMDVQLQGRPLELERRHYWQAALRLLSERPWLGHGADTFRHAYRDLVPPRAWDPRARTHSLVLETAANLGALGLLALGLLLGVVLAKLGPPLLMPRARTPMAWGAAAGVVALMAHSMVDYFFAYTKIVVVFWPLLGLALALASSAAAGRDEAEADDDAAARADDHA